MPHNQEQSRSAGTNSGVTNGGVRCAPGQRRHTCKGLKETTSMIRENLREIATVERASPGTERYSIRNG